MRCIVVCVTDHQKGLANINLQIYTSLFTCSILTFQKGVSIRSIFRRIIEYNNGELVQYMHQPPGWILYEYIGMHMTVCKASDHYLDVQRQLGLVVSKVPKTSTNLLALKRLDAMRAAASLKYQDL